jgi:WD40 repeat protein
MPVSSPLYAATVVHILVLGTFPLSAQEPKLRATFPGREGDGGVWRGDAMLGEVFRATFSADAELRQSIDRKLVTAGAPASLSAVSICRGLATFHGVAWVPMAFSPDGKLVASPAAFRSDEKSPAPEADKWCVGVRDLAAGRSRANFQCEGDLLALAFDVSSQTVAAASRIPAGRDSLLGPDAARTGEVRLWDVTSDKHTRTVRLQGHPTGILCMAFSPDGKTLASGAGWVEKRAELGVTGEIRLWDVATGKNIAKLESQRGKGCFSNLSAAVRSLAFSPDGKTIASGGSTTAELFDVATGKTIAAAEIGTPIWAVVYSPDGRTLACGGGSGFQPGREEGEVKFLDVTTGKITATVKAEGGPVSCVAFSPDGRALISMSYDGTVKVWEFSADGKLNK